MLAMPPVRLRGAKMTDRRVAGREHEYSLERNRGNGRNRGLIRLYIGLREVRDSMLAE